MERMRRRIAIGVDVTEGASESNVKPIVLACILSLRVSEHARSGPLLDARRDLLSSRVRAEVPGHRPPPAPTVASSALLHKVPRLARRPISDGYAVTLAGAGSDRANTIFECDRNRMARRFLFRACARM